MKSGYERIGRSVSIKRAKRSCLDKRPYETKNDARDAAAKNGKKYGQTLRWYRCTLCHRFHLTTQQEPARARRRNGNAQSDAGRQMKRA